MAHKKPPQGTQSIRRLEDSEKIRATASRVVASGMFLSQDEDFKALVAAKIDNDHTELARLCEIIRTRYDAEAVKMAFEQAKASFAPRMKKPRHA